MIEDTDIQYCTKQNKNVTSKKTILQNIYYMLKDGNKCGKPRKIKEKLEPQVCLPKDVHGKSFQMELKSNKGLRNT